MKNKYLRDFKNITIIQTAFLGDVVLTLPLAAAIKKLAPQSHITFITTPQASHIVKLSKDIDSVISFDKRGNNSGIKGIKAFSSVLARLDDNLILSPHKSLRSSLLTYHSKPAHSISFTSASFSFLYKERIRRKEHLHEIDRNHQLIENFKDYNGNSSFSDVKLEFDYNDTNFADNLLNSLGIKETDKIAFFAPGSVWETKKWPEKHYMELLSILSNDGYLCLVIGSKEDADLCDRIALNFGISLAGKTNIAQSIYILKRGRFIITNDSAPTHFASLADIPSATIFGATSPIFGFSPSSKGSIIIENNDLECKPCRIHGSKKCPKGNFECMYSIKPENVAEKLKNLTK